MPVSLYNITRGPQSLVLRHPSQPHCWIDQKICGTLIGQDRHETCRPTQNAAIKGAENAGAPLCVFLPFKGHIDLAALHKTAPVLFPSRLQ